MTLEPKKSFSIGRKFSTDKDQASFLRDMNNLRHARKINYIKKNISDYGIINK